MTPNQSLAINLMAINGMDDDDDEVGYVAQAPVARDEFEAGQTEHKLSPIATTAVNVISGGAVAALGVFAVVEAPIALWLVVPVLLARAYLTS